LRTLILGGTGLIGSAVAARLAGEGHELTIVSRSPTAPGLQAAKAVAKDLARSADPQDWLPHLIGVDAVVNCAGVLQDGPRDSTAGVHVVGLTALLRACEQAGVPRIVHLSAAGVDRATPTAFSRTKQAGEHAVMASNLDWVILRPSVVFGRAAYGGSALLRGAAALPVMPVLQATGPLQIVCLDDVVAAVTFFVQPHAPARCALDVVGPSSWRFEDAVALLRRWLRWPPAHRVELPLWAAQLMYRAGDAVAWLGWRPPMRSTAGREIVRGAVGDPGRLRELAGIQPRDLSDALASEPASVQERWFAGLYFLKPLVFGVFSLFWIVTGLISLGPGFGIGKALMEEGGAGALAGPSVMAGAFADIAIGIGIAWRPTARWALYAALAISVLYAVAGTILVPRLWADPLGPMLKIWPIMVLNMVALAILDDR
jgi:uncharacterized protein YbjT (DUF2867 family)